MPTAGWSVLRFRGAAMGLLLILGLLCGCAPAGHSTIQWRSQSAADAVLAPEWVEVVARISDPNNIDIFMLDRPLQDTGASLGEGGPRTLQACHIHIFLQPKAGRTPIQASACTATVRHLVLVGEEAGEYGGAGFMTPRLGSNETAIRASIASGRARLVRATPGFADRLLDAEINGSITARHDPAAARAIERALDRWRFRYFGDSGDESDS
ncbi:MAG: hypothetical protein ACF8NJ_04345 [Phycisphaerales bacterium JB038]